MGEDQERDETAARTDRSSDCCCPWILELENLQRLESRGKGKR
ncbi:hypothetical protein [Paenibacillus sp. AK121]|nr:hypothetical protein [Paenibacillus sp. AK121]